jgi:hypothetical protein
MTHYGETRIRRPILIFLNYMSMVAVMFPILTIHRVMHGVHIYIYKINVHSR